MRRDDLDDMHRQRALNLIITLAIIGLSCACGDELPSDAGGWRGGPAVCDGGARAPSATRAPVHALLGPTSNAIVRAGAHAFIVESGSNTLSRLDLATGEVEAGFLDVGNERNPYDVAVDLARDEVVTANYLTGSVTIARASTGEVIEELQDARLRGPSGVALTERAIYVACANYLGPQQGYGDGEVVVIDRATRQVVGVIALEQQNAQFAVTLDTIAGPRVAIVSTGVLAFDAQGARTASDGALELWTEGEDLLQPAREVHVLPAREDDPRAGAPGRPVITPDGAHIYLASATAPILFKLDVAQGRWLHDTSTPLRFDTLEGDALHHIAIDERGILYVTSFNRDALFLYDTRCDSVLSGPHELGTSPQRIEGPHGLVVSDADASGARSAYYIMSLSHTLGRLSLAP